MPTASYRLRNLPARLASLAGCAVVVSCGWFSTMELLLRHDDEQVNREREGTDDPRKQVAGAIH